MADEGSQEQHKSKIKACNVAKISRKPGDWEAFKDQQRATKKELRERR